MAPLKLVVVGALVAVAAISVAIVETTLIGKEEAQQADTEKTWPPSDRVALLRLNYTLGPNETLDVASATRHTATFRLDPARRELVLSQGPAPGATTGVLVEGRDSPLLLLNSNPLVTILVNGTDGTNESRSLVLLTQPGRARIWDPGSGCNVTTSLPQSSGSTTASTPTTVWFTREDPVTWRYQGAGCPHLVATVTYEGLWTGVVRDR